MPEFDPYWKWLGIPPDQQPPHPYRLLAIELFEQDREVIGNAADRQMAHLRTFQAGPHRDLCQKLLNEVASAQNVLLDEEKKSRVDRRLRSQQAATPPASTNRPIPVPASPIPVAGGEPDGRPSQVAQPIVVASDSSAGAPVSPSGRRRAAAKNPAVEIAKVAAGGAVGLSLAALILYAIGYFNAPPPPPPDPGPIVTRPIDVPRPQPESDPFLPLDGDTGSPFIREPESYRWSEWSEDGHLFGARDAPRLDATQVEQQIDRLQAVAGNLDKLAESEPPLSPEQRVPLEQPFAAALTELAVGLTYCDPADPQVKEQLQRVDLLLRELGDTAAKREQLAAIARRQLDDAKSTGIAVLGEVKEIVAERFLFTTVVKLPGAETEVPVYSWIDPAMSCKAGDTVMLLGAMVDDPRTNLGGYEGEAPRVVWGGYLIRHRP